MSGTVTAEIRFINPEWKHRKVPARIGDRTSRRANTTKHKVPIEDARGTETGLDMTGFTLISPQVQRDRLPRRFGGEIDLLPGSRQRSCSNLSARTRYSSHTIILRTEDTSDFLRAYARFAHCDYDIADPASNRKRALADRREALDASSHWEFAWYNTWQPVDRAAIRNPLALIDARSIDPNDILPYYYSGSYATGKGAIPLFKPNLRLCYFPRMTEKEVLVIKQLDTRPGRAIACPHTSFDIDAPPGTPARRSIEVRMVCAFSS